MSHIYENFCRMRELIKQAEECGVEMMAASYLELERDNELMELSLDRAQEAETILREICQRSKRVKVGAVYEDTISGGLLERARNLFGSSPA